jgi:Mg2+ and Co2+ transporter CorA
MAYSAPGEAHPQPVDFAAVARTLAGEIGDEPGSRGWRRVTTLLDEFGLYRLTTDTRARIAVALADAGLEADPPIERAQRHETVRLTLPGERRISTVDNLVATKMIRFFDAVPGEAIREIELAQAGSADGVLLVDLDVLTVDAGDAEKALARACGADISRAVVDDLLSADPRPKTIRFGDGGVRLVATVHVSAEEHEVPSSESKAGSLVFRPVEIAVGDGWVVIARHKGGVYHGATEIAQTDPLPLERLIHDVQPAWGRLEAANANDLGMLMLDAMATSYRAAHRELYAWLESWELDFNDRLHQTEQETLKDIRGLLTIMRVRLTALSPAHDRPSEAWFAGALDDSAAESLDRKLERALRQLDETSEALRSSLQVLTTAGTAEQLRLAQDQRERSRQLDDRITMITALLLVPTLIVGIYGANTMLPGRDHWAGFGLMLGLIVASAVFTLWVVRRARRQDETDDQPGEPG